MPIKPGPWLAAALVGAIALAVAFGFSLLVPAQYSAAGRLEVPAAAVRTLDGEWPDASRVNRWLAQPLPVRPLVEVNLEELGHAAPSIVVTVAADRPEATAESVNQVLKTAQQELRTLGVQFEDERHRALLTLLHRARAERNRAQRQLDRMVAQRLREVAAAEKVPAAQPSLAPAPASTPVPTVSARNPLFDDLVRQVGEMEGRRAGLLQTMTPAHPVVRDLDWRLTQLRDQLRASPEFTTAPDPTAVGPLPQVVEARSEPSIAAPLEPADAPARPATITEDDLRKQRSIVGASDMRLGIAIQQERAAWQQLSNLRAAIESSVVPATIPAHADPSIEREQLRWAGTIFAMALAGGTLWGLRPRKRVLRTVEDIGRTLNVPVLGKLSASPRT